MARIRLDQDLRSVTEFRAHAAALIDHVRTTKRPVVLTQHGRGAAVIVDVGEYERMIDVAERNEAVARSPVQTAHDPVQAYKEGIDQSLIRENLSRSVAERIRRLGEMSRFADALHEAPRRETR